MQWTLAQYYTADEIAPAFTWTTLLGIDRPALSRSRLFQGHFYGPLEQIIGTACNTFTVLRDPIERALSHYGHVLSDKMHYLHRRALELETLDAYLEDRTTQMTVSNFQSRMLAMDFDVQQFYSNLKTEERQQWLLERYIETTDFELQSNVLFSRAQAKLQTFFLVGVTERFPATLAILCHSLGWKYPESTSDKNINVQRVRQNELAEHTLKRLKELNAIDIAVYSAAYDTFDNRINNLLINMANTSSNGSLLRRLIA